MLNNDKLSNINNNELGIKNVKILDIKKVNDFLFITLDNNQIILTNGNEIYDVSDYDHLFNLFSMGDKFCAVMQKGYSTYVINLKTMEILFHDDKAYRVHKQDDRTLHVIMKIDNENTNLYDIETKKYLPSPENYEFENSLGHNLYVFREKHNSETDFYGYKRCIINADGKVILKDIDGWIELCNNYIIIQKSKELCIVNINKDFSLDVNIIKQNDKIIAKPKYHDGNIIVIEKDSIKFFAPNLNLVHQIETKELESVIDYEIVSNTLKICLPYNLKGENISKHLFINLKNRKSISHARIDGYPYWSPKTYVGKDDKRDEEISGFQCGKTYKQTKYYFYDSDFNKITDIKGNFYSNIDDENIFIVGVWDGKKIKRTYINTKNNTVKNCNYDIIKFLPNNLYGYAFNTITDMIDIIDKDLNVIIPNIDYKQLGLPRNNDFFGDFTYFVVNDYVCIIKHVANGPSSSYRNIIQNANGEIILDSMQHECYSMGNLIQIVKNGKSEFLNTLTGEIGQLSIATQTDENRKIEFSKISNFKNIFQVDKYKSIDDQSPKQKKLIPNTRKDN